MTWSNILYYVTNDLMLAIRVFGPGVLLCVISVWIARGIAR